MRFVRWRHTVAYRLHTAVDKRCKELRCEQLVKCIRRLEGVLGPNLGDPEREKCDTRGAAAALNDLGTICKVRRQPGWSQSGHAKAGLDNGACYVALFHTDR